MLTDSKNLQQEQAPAEKNVQGASMAAPMEVGTGLILGPSLGDFCVRDNVGEWGLAVGLGGCR